MRVGLGISLLAGAVILMASGQVSAATADIQWPDTGQSKCYDNAGDEINCDGSEGYPGQDGSHSGPAPSYTDNGQTVTDNVTGLLWQQDGATSGEFTLAGAEAYVATLALPGCGGSWDLPTAQELSSLVNAGLDIPAQDGPITLSTDSLNYWTKTDEPGGGTNDRMQVRFRYGTVEGTSGYGPTPELRVLAVCRD